MKIQEQIHKVSDLINQSHYSNANEESLKVLEKVLRDIYKEVIVNAKIQEKNVIFEKEKEKGDGKSFKDFQIGQILGLFLETGLLDIFCKLKSKETMICHSSILHMINNVRKKCTHDDYHSYKEEAEFIASSVKCILYELGYSLNNEETQNEKEETSKTKENDEILHSKIPKIDAAEFIGREDKIKEVMDWLDSNRAPIISIDGIGGVGKSTLAIKVAERLIQTKKFDAIIWVSAKKDMLTPEGIKTLDDEKCFENIEDLFDEILRVFEEENAIKYNIEEKEKIVRKTLEENHCLIIIDNLETITDQKIKDFLTGKDFPGDSKVLITSRKLLGEMEKAVFIKEFTKEETSKFIKSQLEYSSYQREMSNELVKLIHEFTGGIPLAIKVLIPLIIKGNLNLDNVEKITKDTEILDFCFDKLYNEALDTNDKKLFCIISLAPSTISETAIKFISGNVGEIFEKSINDLLNYSLIFRDIEVGNKSDTFYKMLPLTREFGIKKSEEFSDINKTEINKQYLKFIEESKMDLSSSKKSISINHAEKARRLALGGNIEEAEILFRKAIEMDSSCDYAFYLYTIFAKERQNYGHALKLINKALSIDSSNPRYWMEYGFLAEEQGEFKKAERVLTQAVEKTKNNLQVLQLLIRVKERLHKNSEAITLSKKSIIKNPDSKGKFINSRFLFAILEGYWRLGAYSNKNKEIEKAIQYWKKALEDYDSLKYLTFINNGLEKQEKKIARALGQLYESFDPNESLKYYKRSIYKYVKYPDRQNHNNEILKKIEQLKK